MDIRLGVNIDHVATLRQARKTAYPSPLKAAALVELAGADSIVVHLREDRRHMQDRDVFLLKETLEINLNLEMSINPEIVEVACRLRPYQATLVPEKREELTTEGGLDILKYFNKVKNTVRRLKDKGINVSLFIDPDISQIEKARKTGADSVEIHTGGYAQVQEPNRRTQEFQRIVEVAGFSSKIGFKTFAGHGLNYSNVKPIANVSQIEELNIGHAIISRAVFTGLYQAVCRMKELLRESRG